MHEIKGMEGALAGLRFCDLFAGIGGFSLALESFGAECVFASEIDEDCQDVYERNFGRRPAGDITMIAAEDMPGFDLLCGGFPCNAFTIAGTRGGFDDPRGRLFLEVIRIARARRPRAMLLENVPGLLSHDEGRTFGTVMEALSGAGYQPFVRPLLAGEFGIPQARERLFFVCVREDIPVRDFSFPEPRGVDVVLGDILLPRDEVRQYEIDLTGRKASVCYDPVPRQPRPCQVGTVNSGSQGQRIYHANGHSITLCHGGGGLGSKTGMYLVDGVVRRLAPRECARLSGFPEWFELHPKDAVAKGQFGNSVVVDVVQEAVAAMCACGVLAA